MIFKRAESRQYVGGEDSQVALWVTEFEKRHPASSIADVLFYKNIVILTYTEGSAD